MTNFKILIIGQIWVFRAFKCSNILSDKAVKSYPPSRKEITLPWEWVFAISTIFFVILKKSRDSKLILAKGSRKWASKPADIKIASGLNLSIGVRTFFSKMVVSILNYGSEVWGLRQTDPIEKFH